MHRILPIAALALAACLDSKVQSDFDVQLVPRAPIDQSPIDDAPELGLVIRDNNVRVLPLGASEDDARVSGVEALGVEPLTTAHLGIVGADTLSELTAAAVFSYGEVGPFTLGSDEDILDVDVLVAETGRVGALGTLSDARTALGAAVAVSSTGDAFLFGGVDTSGTSRDTISRLSDLDAGTWTFETIGAMPGGERVSATASVVDRNGEEAILVAGGRSTPDDLTTALDAAFLLDAADGLVSWTGTSRAPRSGHQATVLANGRVLLIGGDVSPADGLPVTQATFEVFDPGFQVFNSGSVPVSVPPDGFGLANVGSVGVMVCGGHVLRPAVQQQQDADPQGEPTGACSWITPLGAVSDAPALPLPLTGLALAAVDERHVLATGGLAGTRQLNESAPATSQSWLYTLANDSWQELGPMVNARAFHRALATPDGRIVIVGGVGSASADGSILGTPVICSEVYDPVDRRWDEGGCSDTGSGAHAAVGVHPLHGAVVFSGAGTLGQDYGFIPYPPVF